MMFINPNIDSSYKRKEMGRFLYDAILSNQAKKIIDFGVLNGYSTVCMALAAKITGGTVYAYDLFEDYPFAKSNLDVVTSNIKKYGVENNVIIRKKNFEEWIKNPEDFDVLHVDISNTGKTIEKLWSTFKGKKNARIFFEGGSKERDMQDWMLKYNMPAISSLVSTKNFKLLEKDAFTLNGREFNPCISELLI